MEISELQSRYDCALLALVLWREARGEPVEAKRAVAWVIRNRVLRPSWWGKTWSEVITKRWQFTSMTGRGDANLLKWPDERDTAWQACLEVAAAVQVGQGTDPTQGATHYFDRSLDATPPAWAGDAAMQHVMDIGAFHFYRQGS